MKDYSKMSDFEICGYVSMYEHGFSWIEFDDEMSSHVKCGNEGSPGFAIVEVKDYCNNPSDAWPIIFENEISLVVVDDDTWVARIGGIYDESSNPLRSAMVVYLKIGGQEK